MPIVDIIVKACCDTCGRPFSVIMDTTTKRPAAWSAYDMAVAAIRGGHALEGGCSSVQESRLLCQRCTETKDSAAYKKATEIVEWLTKQTYQGKEILHAVVCCDHASRQHFIEAIAEIL